MNTWKYQTPLVLLRIDLMQDATENQSAMPRSAKGDVGIKDLEHH